MSSRPITHTKTKNNNSCTVMLHMPHIQEMVQAYVNISLKYPPLAISRVELTTLYLDLQKDEK